MTAFHISARRAWLGGALVASTAGALGFVHAQQQPPTFRAGVNVVQVDVSVLDNKRQPVRGLKASDFTVLEDGKPREIVAFTAVDLPPRTATTAAAGWVRDVAPDVATNNLPVEGRLVVIAFDWSIRFQDSPLARKIAIAAVNNLGPGDQAAVVYTSGFANAGVPQNFTADRERLLDAINQPMAFAMQGNDVLTTRVGGFINANGVMLEDPSGYTSSDCHCRVCAMEAMTRIADAVRPVTGRRKMMIFIGTHFRGYEAAMPVPTVGLRGMPPPPGATTQFLVPDNLAGGCSPVLREAREKMERATSLANLTIHVVDPVGLETLESSPLGGASPETIMKRQDGLRLPAEWTGGRTVLNTNAPETAVPAIFEESQAYYLIGFSASDTSASRLHRIEVKVARRDVDTHTRAGYYGNEEAAAVKGAGPTTPLLRAVDGAMPRTDMPLSLVAAPFATPGKTTGTVALVLGAQTATRTENAGASSVVNPRRGPIHVAIAALDPKGRLVASREESVQLVLNPGTAEAQPAYEVLSRLELKPGRYEIRVGTDNASGERGSVFTFVDVPDFAKESLTMTGVSISAKTTVPAAPVGLFADIMPVAPTARRVFSKSDDVTAFLRLHQAAAAPSAVTVLTRIVGQTNRVAFDETRLFPAAQFAAARTADYQLVLPLARLEPGEYVLAVQASTPKEERRRNIRFTVR